MRPIRIYLDTSDYARLLAPKPESELAKIKNNLITSVDKQIIEIGYSSLVVNEFIKDGDLRYKEDRRDKGRLLKTLTRQNCFPHISDLKTGAEFPNDRVWLPRRIFDHLKGDFVLEHISQKLKGDPRYNLLNRKLRRKLSSVKGLQEEFRFRGFTKHMNREDYYPIPVTDEFIEGRYLERLLEGTITPSVFRNAMLKWANDPEEYYELAHQYLQIESPLDKLLDDFYGKFVAAIEELRRHIDYYYNIRSEAKSARRRYYDLLRASELPEKITNSMPKPRKIPTDPKIPGTYSVSDKLRDLFPEGHLEYIDEYIQDILRGRKPRRSDFVDILHFQYIYYCDLFRCDAAMASLYSESSSLPASRIVSRLEHLPDRISQLIEARDAN